MGAEVFSTSDAEQGYLQDDPSDPSRKLIRQVLGAVAEYERAMIRLRLRLVDVARLNRADTPASALPRSATAPRVAPWLLTRKSKSPSLVSEHFMLMESH